MEELLLKNQLCFPLYATSKEITRYYAPLLKPLDLTYTQYLVLLVLWERKQITMKELGQILCLDSGTLTPVVKKLASKQYINRKRDDSDERVTILSLTDAGQALQDQAKDIPEKILDFLPLEEEELAMLLYLTKKMLKNFNKEQHAR
ncbi:MarR family transcriptional regulator [Enterococcus sp. DIV1298c]|uniref:HTH-type transcriptional regulator SarZ n=1 Tax=Candidatus Enterococcus mangumiae TaxID=2230878 RepID=A0ABZ2SZC3_9ENTE|nr:MULTISPECIES: MarR family transcriptional regulator [unclassified Enterococcus]MBO0462181.1 MarR family transcriptional regulator [Enterococcus sp. DIV1298c]MBO0489074.1 MarR family transcriptional regulator [Enterococcus sp. DIV1094]